MSRNCPILDLISLYEEKEIFGNKTTLNKIKSINKTKQCLLI